MGDIIAALEYCFGEVGEGGERFEDVRRPENASNADGELLAFLEQMQAVEFFFRRDLGARYFVQLFGEQRLGARLGERFPLKERLQEPGLFDQHLGQIIARSEEFENDFQRFFLRGHESQDGFAPTSPLHEFIEVRDGPVRFGEVERLVQHAGEEFVENPLRLGAHVFERCAVAQEFEVRAHAFGVHKAVGAQILGGERIAQRKCWSGSAARRLRFLFPVFTPEHVFKNPGYVVLVIRQPGSQFGAFRAVHLARQHVQTLLVRRNLVRLKPVRDLHAVFYVS